MLGGFSFDPDHVALSVGDLERSKEFYSWIGGKIVSRPSPFFAEILLGSQRLHLVLNENLERGHATSDASALDHFCVRVPSPLALEALRDRLADHPLMKARGKPLKIVESPPLGADGKTHVEENPPSKTLYFQDPDGVEIEVRSYS